MKLSRTLPIAALAFALVAIACGGDSEAELPLNDNNSPAAACLADDPDCQDLGGQPTDEPLFVDDEPVDAPPTEDPGVLIGRGMAISEVLATDIDGGFAIEGFYVDDGSGPLLCEALAESFPPQCGGASIGVDNSAGVELDGLQTEGAVTWTDQPAVLIGEVVDGVFVVSPMES